MTLIVAELRDALVEAGATPEKAEAAARAVLERQEAFDRLATKADIADAKHDLLKWFAAILVAQGLGIVTATVALVKLL